MENVLYDVIIIGGGPAGYTAALYCARSDFRTLVIEKLSAGGQMALTTQIDNYPGFEEGIDGFELGMKMQKGAERFGAETLLAQVVDVNFQGNEKTVMTSEGNYKSRAVVIAAGASPRKLGIAGEDQLVNKGIAYCAACDGMAFRGKTVLVIGGGNSAAADAMLLSKICKKVFVVHRRDQMRADPVYTKALKQAEHVEFIWNTTVKEIIHDEKVTGALLTNKIDGTEKTVPCDGIFVSIGRKPNTEIFAEKVDMDDHGYLIADETTKTSIDGVFAAGDIRTKKLRQIVTAASDGAVTSHEIQEYLG